MGPPASLPARLHPPGHDLVVGGCHRVHVNVVVAPPNRFVVGALVFHPPTPLAVFWTRVWIQARWYEALEGALVSAGLFLMSCGGVREGAKGELLGTGERYRRCRTQNRTGVQEDRQNSENRTGVQEMQN